MIKEVVSITTRKRASQMMEQDLLSLLQGMLLDDSDPLMLLSSNDTSRIEVGLGLSQLQFRPPDLDPSRCSLGQAEEIGTSIETTSCSMSHR
jgi:hypothetical protein